MPFQKCPISGRALTISRHCSTVFTRYWSLIDLCKVAAYFDKTPSEIMAEVEHFCQAEGLLHPSRTVAKIIDMGLAGADREPILIFTRRQSATDFVLVDCDAEWKRCAKGEIR